MVQECFLKISVTEVFGESLPLGFNPDVLYEFGAGADAVDFFSCRLPNE